MRIIVEQLKQTLPTIDSRKQGKENTEEQVGFQDMILQMLSMMNTPFNGQWEQSQETLSSANAPIHQDMMLVHGEGMNGWMEQGSMEDVLQSAIALNQQQLPKEGINAAGSITEAAADPVFEKHSDRAAVPGKAAGLGQEHPFQQEIANLKEQYGKSCPVNPLESMETIEILETGNRERNAAPFMKSSRQTANGWQLVEAGQAANGSQAAEDGQAINDSQAAKAGQIANSWQAQEDGQAANGWQAVKDGQTLNGWQAANGWKAEDGEQATGVGQAIEVGQAGNQGHKEGGLSIRKPLKVEGKTAGDQASDKAAPADLNAQENLASEPLESVEPQVTLGTLRKSFDTEPVLAKDSSLKENQSTENAALPLDFYGASTDRVGHEPDTPSQPVQIQNLQEIAAQWKEKITVLSEGEHSSLKLTLKPEQLGEIEVRFRMKDGFLSGKILVETVSAREAIEGQLQNLKERLRNQNVILHEVDIGLYQENRQPNQERRHGFFQSSTQDQKLSGQAIHQEKCSNQQLAPNTARAIHRTGITGYSLDLLA